MKMICFQDFGKGVGEEEDAQTIALAIAEKQDMIEAHRL